MTYVMLVPDAAYVAARPKIKNHHMTLAYFGDTTQEDTARLNRSVERWAYQLKGPIAAVANGIGMFDGGADGVALVDLIDGIGCLQARNLIEASYGMSRVGYRLDTLQIGYKHGFTPHITREYLAAEDEFYAEICVDMVPSLAFNFIAIGVWSGPASGTVKYEVEL